MLCIPCKMLLTRRYTFVSLNGVTLWTIHDFLKDIVKIDVAIRNDGCSGKFVLFFKSEFISITIMDVSYSYVHYSITNIAFQMALFKKKRTLSFSSFSRHTYLHQAHRGYGGLNSLYYSFGMISTSYNLNRAEAHLWVDVFYTIAATE